VTFGCLGGTLRDGCLRLGAFLVDFVGFDLAAGLGVGLADFLDFDLTGALAFDTFFDFVAAGFLDSIFTSPHLMGTA